MAIPVIREVHYRYRHKLTRRLYIVKSVITIYTITIERIKPTPTPTLSLNKLLIFKMNELLVIFCFIIPEDLKIDAIFMITPLIPSYLNNTASGSILYEHRQVFHYGRPLPLSDHKESIPSLLTEFSFYSLFSASDRESKWEVA